MTNPLTAESNVLTRKLQGGQKLNIEAKIAIDGIKQAIAALPPGHGNAAAIELLTGVRNGLKNGVDAWEGGAG